ncbi:hypothetical protein ACJJTC_017073 [Scirpophaga incertulas]
MHYGLIKMNNLDNIWNYSEDTTLDNYTVIFPCVAVGNVAQLACDLLISSLKMTKIASVYSKALIPVVGYDPYDLNSSNLSCSCEMYKSDDKKLIVFQIRAPIVIKYASEFLEEVITKLKEKNIGDMIILTSSFAYEKKHISTSPFRYVSNESCPYNSTVKTLDCLVHESDSDLKIHGGGFASLLYRIASQKLLPCLIFFKYCSEGNNIPDAYEMVEYISKLLPIIFDKKDCMLQFVQPPSWKLLFGKPPPSDIY